MRPTHVSRYKDQLTEMRARLAAAVEQSLATLVEDITPPGEHELAPAEGVDAETAIERSEASLLNAVNAALDRIERGTYGRCRECGEAIQKDRLDALPYADLCIDCERMQEAGAVR